MAVLYSWANLHGAKYRDFSASRREYRAQLRHRAAEQVREQALLAQAEAEAAAAAADSAARQARRLPVIIRPKTLTHPCAALCGRPKMRPVPPQPSASKPPAAPKPPLLPRPPPVAKNARSPRPTPQHRDRRAICGFRDSPQSSGRLRGDRASRQDRRSLHGPLHSAKWPSILSLYCGPQRPAAMNQTAPSDEMHPSNGPDRREYRPYTTAPAAPERRAPGITIVSPSQGYRPDEASGVRQIYRGPDSMLPTPSTLQPSTRQSVPEESRAVPVPRHPRT